MRASFFNENQRGKWLNYVFVRLFDTRAEFKVSIFGTLMLHLYVCGSYNLLFTCQYVHIVINLWWNVVQSHHISILVIWKICSVNFEAIRFSTVGFGYNIFRSAAGGIHDSRFSMMNRIILKVSLGWDFHTIWKCTYYIENRLVKFKKNKQKYYLHFY